MLTTTFWYFFSIEGHNATKEKCIYFFQEIPGIPVIHKVNKEEREAGVEIDQIILKINSNNNVGKQSTLKWIVQLRHILLFIKVLTIGIKNIEIKDSLDIRHRNYLVLAVLVLYANAYVCYVM